MSSLSFSVPAPHVPVFAAAVQCLGKIGKELYFEMNSEAVVLRTLNDAKSAFAAFHFGSEFFEHVRASTDGTSVKCKMLIRSCQNVFRSVRNVETMIVSLDSATATPHIVFQFLCKFGITKTHSLVFEDCEIFQAVFRRDTAPNRLMFRPSTLSKFISHIHGTVEVTLDASHTRVEVRSFHQNMDETLAKSVLQTNLHILPQEFERYDIDPSVEESVDVTFSLRECKAILSFCDAPGVRSDELSLYFHSKGMPILFTTEGMSSGHFHADLVLATIQDGWDGGSSTGDRSQQQEDAVKPASQGHHGNSNVDSATPRGYGRPDKRARTEPTPQGPQELPEGYDCEADGSRRGIVDEVDYGGDYDWEGQQEEQAAADADIDFGAPEPSVLRTPAPAAPRPPSASVGGSLATAPQERPHSSTPRGILVSEPRGSTPSATPRRSVAFAPGFGFERPPSASLDTQPTGDDYEEDTAAPVYPPRTPELGTAPSGGRSSSRSSSEHTKGPLRGPPSGVARRLPTDSQARLFTPTQDGEEEDTVPPEDAEAEHDSPVVPTAPFGLNPVYGFDGTESESIGLTPGPEVQQYRRW